MKETRRTSINKMGGLTPAAAVPAFGPENIDSSAVRRICVSPYIYTKLENLINSSGLLMN